jgi:hypothetical protein
LIRTPNPELLENDLWSGFGVYKSYSSTDLLDSVFINPSGAAAKSYSQCSNSNSKLMVFSIGSDSITFRPINPSLGADLLM